MIGIVMTVVGASIISLDEKIKEFLDEKKKVKH